VFWLLGERPVILEGTEAGPVEAGPMEATASSAQVQGPLTVLRTLANIFRPARPYSIQLQKKI
jgi:hypothetical protein